MGRGACRATVHGVAKVGYHLATKPEEMDNFLETYKQPRLKQTNRKDSLNRLITRSEIEFVIEKLETKSRTRWLHRGVLPNI